VNGQLADLLGARKIVTIGIIGSSLATFYFGFSGGIIQMIVAWGINGYFQSMGFSPNVKLLGDWFSVEERGPIMGLYGSCYQIGNAFAWLLSGYLASVYGWRYVFWIPSVIFASSSIMYYWAIRDNPHFGEEEIDSIGLRQTIIQTIMNRDLWIIALSFFFVDIVRYGFFVWAPTFLFEVQNASISSASLKVIIIPLAGSLGAVLSGVLSKKFFNDRRALLASILLFFLGVLSYLYPLTPPENWILGLFEFALIGFCTYGAHVLIVAAMPIDFSVPGGTASATGFIDGFGYLGAVCVSYISGWLIDSYGWSSAFNFWTISAFISSIILIPLWKKQPIK
jgi:sugar phosphate permease